MARFFTGNIVLKSADFRWLALGSGLNSAGMQGEQVIIGLLVYRLTESSAWVGISLALFFAPMLLVGVPAGALADRYDRRAVLIWTECGLVALLAAFAWLLAGGAIDLTAALAMSVLSGVLRAIHHPARLSYAGAIVARRDLLSTLSVLSIVTRLGQLSGALVAGLVSEYFSPASAYLVLASGHGIALWCFIKVTRRDSSALSSATDAADTLLNTILDYLRLLRTHTTILLLIIFASAIEIFGFSFATAMPEIAVERLALSDGGLGVMHAMRSAGGLIGALILSLLIVYHMGTLYLAVMMGFGLALILLAVAADLSWVLLAVAVIAIFASAADIIVQSMLQNCVPDALRGRAMGAWVVALGMGPIGHLQLGLLMSTMGITAALATNGVVLLLTGLGALLWLPTIRAIRNE